MWEIVTSWPYLGRKREVIWCHSIWAVNDPKNKLMFAAYESQAAAQEAASTIDTNMGFSIRKVK
jgi:hypothetical protein